MEFWAWQIPLDSILPLNHSKDGDPLKSHHGSIAHPNHQVLCPLSRHKTSCSTRISENCCSKSQSCCCSFSRCCLNSSLSDGTIRGWSKLGYLGISKDTLEHLRTLFADSFSLKSEDSTLGRVPFDICELRRLTFIWAVAGMIFTTWQAGDALAPKLFCIRKGTVAASVMWRSQEGLLENQGKQGMKQNTGKNAQQKMRPVDLVVWKVLQVWTFCKKRSAGSSRVEDRMTAFLIAA